MTLEPGHLLTLGFAVVAVIIWLACWSVAL
jgi:hypothetical protein